MLRETNRHQATGNWRLCTTSVQGSIIILNLPAEAGKPGIYRLEYLMINKRYFDLEKKQTGNRPLETGD
jgi:hypothetical protein